MHTDKLFRTREQCGCLVLFGEKGKVCVSFLSSGCRAWRCGVSSLSEGGHRLAFGVLRVEAWAVKERTLATFLLREGVSETVGEMRVGVEGCEGKGEAWVHLLGCGSVFMFSTKL